MTQEECLIDISNTSVCIAIPCYSGSVPIETAVALSDTTSMLAHHGVTSVIMAERGNGLVTCVRNILLQKFLASDFEYIFWIDDDIIFSPDDFLRVFAYATLNKNTAATYPTRTDIPKFYITLIDDKYTFNEHGLLESKGLGLGFSCIHRSLLEDLVKTKESYFTKEGTETKDVFQIGAKNGEYFGEDINFFKDLYSIGYKTYIDTNIHLKHVGRKDYSAKLVIQNKEI